MVDFQVSSAETLAFMTSDGVSLGDSSLETLDDFAPSGEASPSTDGHTLDPETRRHREWMLKLVRARGPLAYSTYITISCYCTIDCLQPWLLTLTATLCSLTLRPEVQSANRYFRRASLPRRGSFNRHDSLRPSLFSTIPNSLFCRQKRMKN